MAGGFGTRLKPLTVSVPKPMVPVGNRPLMEHVINLLAEHDLKSILVLLYFQPEAITDHFGDGDRWGVRIQYRRPNADFGTAGSVRYALNSLADRFVVISGDVLTDINLSEALAFHERVGAEATMVLSRHVNPLAYGIVITDESGGIIRFLEKPSWGEVFSDTINTGIYILERSLMETLPIEETLDFGKDVFPRLLSEGRRLFGFVSPGYWRDVGNVNEYAAAHSDMLEDQVNARWAHPPQARGNGRIIADSTCAIAPDAEFDGIVVLGERVSIGSGVRVSDSVIGPGSVIGAGAHIRRSVLWSAVTVGPQASIAESILQTGVRLGRKSVLRERTVISEFCHIGSNVSVHPNCRIWPRKRVEDGAVVSTSIVWGEQYNRELFSDAKVTGLTNREITPEFAARLGAAFASQYKTAETIVVARDRSAEARAIAEALKAGIAATGVNIRDLRDTIVPILRHRLCHGAGCAGVYLRRTPDETQSTDAIFFDGLGYDLPAGRAQSVERLFVTEDVRRADADNIGTIDYPEGTNDEYRHDLLHHINIEAIRGNDFRIVVDYSGGFTGTIFPGILEALGVSAVSLNSLTQPIDGTTRDLESLSRIVSALGYDLGVMVSTPGERIDLVDRKGEVLSSQQLLLVMASLYWKLHPGTTIAAPVVATSRLETLAGPCGGKVIRVKNDHLAMMRAAAAENVGFVGGTRGGFILPPWQRGADAMASTVLLLEWLALTGLSLTDVTGEMQPGVIRQATVACPWNLKGRLMRRLMEETSHSQRDLVDGVRLHYEDGDWAWMAPDRRTAHFSLLVEARHGWRAESILHEWTERLTHWRDEESPAAEEDAGSELA